MKSFHPFNRYAVLVAFAAVLIFAPRFAAAQYALFSRPTDTIDVPGYTFVNTSITIEARVYPMVPTENGVWGNGIFCEQISGGTGKFLRVAPGLSGTLGQAYAGIGEQPTYSYTALAPAQWHDLVFLRDGDFLRLYTDGALVQTHDLRGTAYDGPIWNSAASMMGIGAFHYINSDPDAWNPSFIGLMDWVRVSSTARYSGDSIDVPTSCPSSDANTLLLYDFNEAPGSTVTHDLSPNGWDGTLGVAPGGLFAATSPTFVPEPASLTLLALGSVGLLIRRRRK